MVESFLSLDYGQSEHIVSRSRFLGFAFFVKSEEAAAKYLKDLISRFFDATHICYAYVIDNAVRFCDDGEPSGTAGAPILEAIKNHKLNKVLVAVVRFFGGTKLGTGGLGRAYSFCANLAISSAKSVRYVFCNIVRFSCDFVAYSKLQGANDFKILSTEYSSDVAVQAAFPKAFGYQDYLNELTNANVQTQIVKTDYIKF